MTVFVYDPNANEPRVTAQWIAPDGTTVDLTDCPAGLDWLPGRGGGDLPPFEQYEDDGPEGDGARIRGIRALPRTYTLPLLLHSGYGGFADWRAAHQQLMRALNPLDGDGTLRILQPDGTARRLTCRYNGGAEGEDVRDLSGLWFRKWALKFRAVDPWWYDEEPQAITWAHAGSVPFFPLLPVSLSSSGVLGTTTATNTGDVRTWGIWTIDGPTNGLVLLRNDTLGRWLKLNLSGDYALADGQQVTVDMRPGREAITGPNGENWFGARLGVPDFWPVVRGENDLTLTVDGATAGTAVTFAYTPAHLTE